MINTFTDKMSQRRSQNTHAILTLQNIPSQQSQRSESQICYLKTILNNSGVILSSNDSFNIITREQALVVRDIERHLEDGDSIEENVKQFLSNLKLLCKKQKYFKKALQSTLFRKIDHFDNAIDIQQDSLFRIFLKVTHVQDSIIEFLMDEVITTVNDEEHPDTPWLRLLLNQLRYLPHVTNPKNLSNHLLDILEISPFVCQLEILESLPDIVPDSEYGKIAEHLSQLLDKNDELSGAIIDCLSTLNLDTDIKTQIQDRILAKVCAGACRKIFPVLLQFLMTDYKAQNLSTTFVNIRNALDTIMSSSHNSKEKESEKVIIYNKLQALATTPKVVFEAWINVINNIKVPTDHKPIDFLILFMLHSTASMKKRLIETIFRKRVKNGLFKCSQLEKLFEKYLNAQLLKDCFKSITEIGSNLLRTSTEPVVTEFASNLFKLTFNHEFTEVIYRQELIENLILLTAASDHKNVGVVLAIFQEFLDDIPKIQQHTILIMRLLEMLDNFELKDIKALFEILCMLTCGEKADESMSGLQDEIHMIIRKQLSSSKRIIKHRGIVAAVVMAKHIAITSEDQNDISIPDESILSIVNLPPGRSKEAATLLEIAHTSTSITPELTGFYYDQLATMLLTTKNLDRYFTTWLFECATNDFQKNYVTDGICEKINDLEFSIQYNLNAEEEIDLPIAVNIAELTLKPSDDCSILILSPHFRLLRLLHYRQQNGDLTSIDALLGCGVILPKVDNLDNLESDQLKQVADCLFHCINWFRETISGFVKQKSRKLRYKVIQRLNNLIDIEKLLITYLDGIPAHKLPSCHFDTFTQNTIIKPISPLKKDNNNKRPKKKIKIITQQIDETIPSTSTVKKATIIKKTIMPERNFNFRVMDTDIVLLLKYPINFADEPCEEQTCINIQQLNFILKDFAMKLKILIQGKNVGLSHLNVVVPTDIITDCVVILPNINKHLNVIIAKTNELLKQVDGCYDSPELFTEHAENLKISFGLILEIFYLLFSWSGFQHSRMHDLLKEILKSLRGPDEVSLNSANKLSGEFINKLIGYTDQCLQLNHAIHLINTMHALYAIIPSPDVKTKIVNTSKTLLCRRWYNNEGSLEGGRNYSENIDCLVKYFLDGSNIKVICDLVGTLQEEVSTLQSKHDCLNMLSSINKSTFPIFYRNLCNSLQVRVKTEIQSLTNNEHLILWKTTALTMQGLLTISKSQQAKSNMVCFLKKSIGILKIFLSHGIPILEIMLRSKPDQVVEILKTIQTSTRFLHHLCCYSKLMKDQSLMTYVPHFRLTLETLVYRVKAALVANNCSAAFWMGNLKNRDLAGEDIVSQSTNSTADSNNDSDTEIPDDDDDDSSSDIFNDDDNEDLDGSSRSGSEVFD